MSTDEQQADLESFHDWLLNACSRGAVPIVTGKNGDMDTIGSAVALSAACLLYTSPSPRDLSTSRMPSSA